MVVPPHAYRRTPRDRLPRRPRLPSPALQRIDRLLRDFRTGEVQAMDPQLFDILHALRITLGGGTFEIISAYRSPATNDMLRKTGGGGVAKRSLHMDGRAIDVRLPGVPTTSLRDAAIGLGLGGVGYYPESDFVHIDTGAVRAWGPRTA
ncbi:YcbK family protein [Thauera sinica]|uniref:YcbK family protein n=1 Tax=Thauera sp. K11 TaxID=2005884 RepID=UPI002FC710CC